MPLDNEMLEAIGEIVGRVMAAMQPPPAPGGHEHHGPPHGGAGRDPIPNWISAINNFKRKPPVYTVGAYSFQQFKMDFNLSAQESGFIPQADGSEAEISRQQVLKGLMYGCLSGEARKLAGRRCYPGDTVCNGLTIMEYSQKLQHLFEPADESESARAEFRCRLQLRGENPIMYFTDKVALFERAWPEAQRDYPMLFDEITAGILNDMLRKEMRRTRAVTEADYEGELRFFTNTLRKQLLAGEIEDQDAEGLDLHSSTMSYLGKRSENTALVKEEPGVFAVNYKGKQSGAKKRRCFHCQGFGHFVANCPRKDAGLPPSTNAVSHAAEGEESTDEEPSKEQDGDKVEGEPNDEVHAIKGRRRWVKQKGAKQRVNFPISNRRWKRAQHKQKLATVYRNGNGVLVVQEDEGDTNDDTDSSSDEGPGGPVNTLIRDDEADDQITDDDHQGRIDFLGL